MDWSKPPADNIPALPPDATADHPMSWAKVKDIFKRLGPLGPLVLIAGSLPSIGTLVLLSTMAWTAPWLRSHGTAGMVLYYTGFATLTGVAILPTHSLSALGGFAFGMIPGGPIALSAVLTASIIGYLIARRVSGDRVIKMIDEQPKWKAVYDSLLGSGFIKTLLIVTLIRIPPNSPFAITNLLLAATRVHPVAYVLGTLVGIAPRTLAAAYAGAQLTDWSNKSHQARWMTVVGIVLAIIVVGIIGTMANRAIAKVTGQAPAERAAENSPTA